MSSALTTAQAMRRADDLGLPDARKDFIVECILDWEGHERPPCCAIGGAAFAAGQEIEWCVVEGVQYVANAAAFERVPTSDWEHIAYRLAIPPEYSYNDEVGKALTIYRIIIDLYDEAGWSRTQIADWLEGVLEGPY